MWQRSLYLSSLWAWYRITAILALGILGLGGCHEFEVNISSISRPAPEHFVLTLEAGTTACLYRKPTFRAKRRLNVFRHQSSLQTTSLTLWPYEETQDNTSWEEHTLRDGFLDSPPIKRVQMFHNVDGHFNLDSNNRFYSIWFVLWCA